MQIVFSLQVTIRASLTGKTPISPVSPDRSGLIVSPETLTFNQQTKPPASVSKSKSNVPAAGKTKMTQNKKQNNRTTKHNLSLKNLRLLMKLCSYRLIICAAKCQISVCFKGKDELMEIMLNGTGYWAAGE